MDRPVNIREVEACRVISMTRVVSIDELGPFHGRSLWDS